MVATESPVAAGHEEPKSDVQPFDTHAPEDFSQEWWELIQMSPKFREEWMKEWIATEKMTETAEDSELETLDEAEFEQADDSYPVTEYGMDTMDEAEERQMLEMMEYWETQSASTSVPGSDNC